MMFGGRRIWLARCEAADTPSGCRMPALRVLSGALGTRGQHRYAGDADPQYVYPAGDEIDQMRVEQRCQHILRDDEEPDPGHQALTAEQRKMRKPHGVEDDDADGSPLNGESKRLVVRIADDFRLSLPLGTGLRPFKQTPR